MEYRYYRELKHNYLVFEDQGKEAEDERYMYKILESGRIKNLVPCSQRNINGEKFFYYEINSMQNLRDRFGSNKMGSEQIRRLLSSIKELMDSLTEFLMGQEGIVFNIQSVYTDLSTGEFKFIYCPFYDEKKSFSDFALELLEIVDEEDNEATDLIYKLCEESAKSGDFIYEIIENISENVEEEMESEQEEQIEPYLPEMSYDEDGFGEDDDKEEVYGNSRLKRASKRLSGKLQLFFSLMFALLVGAMVYIRMNYILSSEENVLSIVVMVISAVTGAVAFIGGAREMKNASPKTDAKDRDDDEEEDEFDDMDETDSFYDAKEPVVEKITRTRKVSADTSSFTRKMKPEGATVVLDEERSGALALFSRNLDKTVRIPLDCLPVTIGKMEGCVDMMLKDASISRMHCRIEESNGRACVRDLGSTNGTFRNGLKLKPQESVVIEEGDEIRIGRVCFDCR